MRYINAGASKKHGATKDFLTAIGVGYLVSEKPDFTDVESYVRYVVGNARSCGYKFDDVTGKITCGTISGVKDGALYLCKSSAFKMLTNDYAFQPMTTSQYSGVTGSSSTAESNASKPVLTGTIGLDPRNYNDAFDKLFAVTQHPHCAIKQVTSIVPEQVVGDFDPFIIVGRQYSTTVNFPITGSVIHKNFHSTNFSTEHWWAIRHSYCVGYLQSEFNATSSVSVSYRIAEATTNVPIDKAYTIVQCLDNFANYDKAAYYSARYSGTTRRVPNASLHPNRNSINVRFNVATSAPNTDDFDCNYYVFAYGDERSRRAYILKIEDDFALSSTGVGTQPTLDIFDKDNILPFKGREVIELGGRGASKGD